MHNKTVHMIAFILMVVGGLNWLLVGAFDFNLVSTIFGEGSTLTKAVYIIVGLSAAWELITHKHKCEDCRT